VISKKNVQMMDEMKSPVPKEKKLRQVRFDPMIVLIEACIRGDQNEMIDILNECQNDPNLKSSVNEINNKSLLHIALMHGNEHLVEFLVNEVQVDINHGDNDGKYIYFLENHKLYLFICIFILLILSFFSLAFRLLGWTCLHYAAALKLWRSLEFLTSLPHCNLNARTNDGWEVKDCSKTDGGRKQCTCKLFISFSKKKKENESI
jgi:ankyrin repeat protein